MLHDHHYRQWVIKQIKDPIVRSYWLHEFANYDPRFLREAIAQTVTTKDEIDVELRHLIEVIAS